MTDQLQPMEVSEPPSVVLQEQQEQAPASASDQSGQAPVAAPTPGPSGEEQPLVPATENHKSPLLRFLYLGQMQPVFICSRRETPTDVILDSLQIIQDLVIEDKEILLYQIIKQVNKMMNY